MANDGHRAALLALGDPIGRSGHLVSPAAAQVGHPLAVVTGEAREERIVRTGALGTSAQRADDFVARRAVGAVDLAARAARDGDD
jgi:hypothetical protein